MYNDIGIENQYLQKYFTLRTSIRLKMLALRAINMILATSAIIFTCSKNFSDLKYFPIFSVPLRTRFVCHMICLYVKHSQESLQKLRSALALVASCFISNASNFESQFRLRRKKFSLKFCCNVMLRTFKYIGPNK